MLARERTHATGQRRTLVRGWIGLVLYTVLVMIGGVLTLTLFGAAPLVEESSCGVQWYFTFMGVGALFAIPAVVTYLVVPVVLDRFDPEPWWALAMAFVWGGAAAAGFSGLINTATSVAAGVVVSEATQSVIESVLIAPLVEEFWKGAFVLGVLVFLRTEFDGVVDGVIYATFTALGFACVENVVYYGRAGYDAYTASKCVFDQGTEALLTTFIVRGILSPWLHPLSTCMFGIGVGMARETTRTWIKWVGPMVGFVLAVLVHGVWNGAAVVSELTGAPFIGIAIAVYLLFMLVFVGVVILLVAREGRIVRLYLKDEVALGMMTKAEHELVCSPIGKFKGWLYGGMDGRQYVRVAAALAFKKWHVTRATKGKKATVSWDFIEPLRRQMASLRMSSGFARRFAPRHHRRPARR